MEELYPRHEKQTKNPAETTGYRYKTEILMSRTQKLKGLAAASLILKTLTIPNQLGEDVSVVTEPERRDTFRLLHLQVVIFLK